MLKKKHIHFIGIGGIGMSGIAQVLYKKGFKVSGSDLSENLIIKRLRKRMKISISHKAGNINDADIVVYSSAIKKNNIELLTAQKLKIPVFSRAMMLAQVMRLKSSITISGSHGKTTTTSLIASIFENSGMDPTILSGGIINSLEINAKLGKGDWIIAEADESDGSFIHLPSTIGVINNIDLEHVDYYKNIKHLKEAFLRYSKNIPFYGFLSLGIDCKNVREIKKKIYGKKIITYGLSQQCNYSATNVKIIKKNNSFLTSFDLVENFEKKKILKNFISPLLGDHNVKNILSSISVSRELKIPYPKIKKALKTFSGVKRRFTVLHKSKDNLIIDDYAHHPIEIKETLKSLKQITKKEIISIFEPHRFSRISAMMNDFIHCFKNSNQIFILPVFSAGEKKKNNIDSAFFYKKLKEKYTNKNIYLSEYDKFFFDKLKEKMIPGNNIIFLGAGLSSKTANKFNKFFKKKC
ncbi:MAG: UDP-N-acetylmuramate--L-alanine ligase [Rickettsiales bacterium]|nr:UDP-N-acetylmuramate--L-alanine ligase [Rickettsiales bacterium]RPG13991.1 MAG: UDP-N-acetylmuramate--L-alanine ligase [Pelagibacteraceae bacterium TMED195]